MIDIHFYYQRQPEWVLIPTISLYFGREHQTNQIVIWDFSLYFLVFKFSMVWYTHKERKE